MSGGEHRPEQQEMCRAVAEAVATGTHLVVQAGTGTGKSLAYLVPAALSGKKVVVATATKALQDQLAEKDLPLVESGLGLPAPARLRRAEGAQQLRLPPAGGRGGLGRDPGGARRPGARAGRRGRAARGDREAGARRHTSRGHGRGGAPVGRLVADVAERRPGRPELRALRPGLEHGERRPARVPGRATTAPRAGAASPRPPANGRRWPTSWW